jgi:hypothetical protein
MDTLWSLSRNIVGAGVEGVRQEGLEAGKPVQAQVPQLSKTFLFSDLGSRKLQWEWLHNHLRHSASHEDISHRGERRRMKVEVDIFSEDGSDGINHTLCYSGRSRILGGNLELCLGLRATGTCSM